MPSSGSLVSIDGAHGEGGGALLRTAISLAALTQQSVRLEGVRCGTDYPGLDEEDLCVLRTLADCCQAELVGAERGSRIVAFHPTRKVSGLSRRIAVEVGARQPNALVVLATLASVLARAGTYSCLEMQGETYGLGSLSYDYWAGLVVDAWARMGLCVFPELRSAGWGRESSGLVTLDIEPSALDGVTWDRRGQLRRIWAVVATSGLAPAVAERGIAHIERLADRSNLSIEARARDLPADRTGAFVTVGIDCEFGAAGFTAMGVKGLRVETLTQRCFGEALDWLKTDSTADPYLGDSLLVPAALASSPTVFKTSRLTPRFLTQVWVTKQFLPIHITVRGKEGEPGVVEIKP
ncbi:MAG: hypothetical protein HY248_00820 [Fimbriimonas ginsengisoli]|uniref:RNA 3'-terminal-phosphate cyclase (ATP) n=1 Tax=Fimbriimonas ginsengisoli TaxID=1005039 RepID=A0A931LRV1_FIMGI|nr:hypothetical protein [Fimbriimonas ginsengisoli]MBI3721068.1 hypothetical protein [Fimbriimonas ginsengisoli]